MTIVHIGSNAMKLLGFSSTEPNDIDMIATYDSIRQYAKDHNIKTFYPIQDGKKIFMRDAKGMIYEVEIAYPGTLAEEFIEIVVVHDPETRVACDGSYIASIDALYMLKMSHRFLKNSSHFKKTMRDIISFEKSGCYITNIWQDWYERRVKETYDYSHPKLNQNKDDFFDTPGVEYMYDHDDIHMAIAYHYKSPAYRQFMKDDAEVECDREKFEKLHPFFQINAVVEESCVLAIERSLVPFPGVKPPREAFLFALEKVCTSITSGWFREYAWRHYDDAIAQFDTFFTDYYQRFQEALMAGEIKIHTPKKGN